VALAPAPSVLAVVVAHDGAAWLPDALEALGSQTHDRLEVVAVDNGSTDGTRQLLTAALPPDRVLVAERDLGFAAAVSMALDGAAAAASDARWVLLVHDDLVLEPDAVARLVEHAAADPDLAIVGPKLLQHNDPRLLQQVGMSIDVTGRVDSGLEPDELDQGQRDHPHEVLYVSTAGMLIRRRVLEELGRFDRRYHVLRDDLDLCWRAWLSGHGVAAVPGAVGRHARALSNSERLGGAAQPGPRYFAERNTLATLLKCYGPARLLVVVPLFFLVGAGRLLGLVATRQVGDAWQTLRAWGWNVRHLPGTLRLRRPVQAARTRPDREVTDLFVRTGPRLRAYCEVVADRLAVAGRAPDPSAGPEPAGVRWLPRFVRRHPVLAVAATLGLVGLVAAVPLLGSGPLRGGDFAPWPESPAAFFQAYASGWNDSTGLGSSSPPSPAQALLGLVGLGAFGSSWAAPRLLLLGALPAAWVLALLAGRLVTRARLPRLAAASAYALSPPALAALTTGRLGGLAATVLLPALVLLGAKVARVRAAPSAAWRATAGTALLAAALVAFEPPAALLLLLAAVTGMVGVAAVPARPDAIRGAAVRILAAAVGAFVLLLPWSLSLFEAGSPVVGGFGDPTAAAAPFWQWLLLVPDLPGFPGLPVGVAFPAAGLLGLLLGYPRRPTVVGGLWSVVLLAVLGAWGLGRAGDAALAWPGLLLLVAAIGYAGLLATAFATAAEYLTSHAFGWRQLLSVATAAVVAVGAVGASAHLLDDPWRAFTVDRPALPAFVGTDAGDVGPYRVLVVQDRDGVLEWAVTGAEGPSMTSFGTPRAPQLIRLVGRALEDAAAGVSPAAAARLGLANVRYVYVPEGGRSPALESALSDQVDLEPQPVEHGLVYRVGRWLPRAAYLSPSVALSASRRGELPPDADPVPLAPVGDDRYAGHAPGAGSLLLAEPVDAGWEAAAGGAVLDPGVGYGHTRLTRFSVPAATDDLTLSFRGQGRRSAAVGLQVVALLLAVSLILRPPRYAEAGR
jgi:GT2 family glycosyltransferase